MPNAVRAKVRRTRVRFAADGQAITCGVSLWQKRHERVVRWGKTGLPPGRDSDFLASRKATSREAPGPQPVRRGRAWLSNSYAGVRGVGRMAWPAARR